MEYFELSRNKPTNSEHQTDWQSVLDPTFAKTISKILYDAGAIEADSGEADGFEQTLVSQESALWDLIAIFSFEAAAGGAREVALALPDWLVRHHSSFCSSNQETVCSLTSGYRKFHEQQVPEFQPDYWPWICRLVALGCFNDALDLFSLHSVWSRWDGGDSITGDLSDDACSAEIAALETVTLLVRRFPKLKRRDIWSSDGEDEEGSQGYTSDQLRIREFDSWEGYLSYRATWLRQCDEVFADANKLIENCSIVAPETSKGLLTILKILQGDVASINGVLGVTDSNQEGLWEGVAENPEDIVANPSWVELLVARLIHVYPAEIHTLVALRQALRDCLREQAPRNEFEHVAAAVIDAACDNDIQTVVTATSILASDWFMTHVLVVLNAHPAGRGPLKAILPHLGCRQDEFYMLDYASSLALHHTLWPLAVAYFYLCPNHGIGAVNALVDRLPPTIDSVNSMKSTLTKAATFCMQHGMPELQAKLWVRQAVVAWQHGYTGAAVTYISKVANRVEPRRNEMIQHLALSIAEMVTRRALKRYKEAVDHLSKQEQTLWPADVQRIVETIENSENWIFGSFGSLSALRSQGSYDAILCLSAMVHSLMAGKDGMGDKFMKLLSSLSPLRREECLVHLWPCLPIVAKSIGDAPRRALLLQWFQEIGEEKVLLAGDRGSLKDGMDASNFVMASGRQDVLSKVRLELVHSLCGNRCI